MNTAGGTRAEATQPLDLFFRPRHVALIGASEKAGSVGRTLLWNLVSHPFGGTVYPVNPKRASVLGIKAYPSIDQVPARVDLAIIATPAAGVPKLVRECAEAGVQAVIVISAGFKERGAQGVALEQELAEAARGVRLIGPNCLGVISPTTGLNASFARGMAHPGSVAFLSQSGALLSAVLDWSLKEQVGFRACISLGSMLDVGWADLIDYFGSDPETQSILIYMESIGNARAFLSAAREVSLSKPIIVIKGGRTAAAAKAAASHTGAMTGSDEVLDAAFERAGVLRVSSIAELFDMAEVLSKQPLPKGPRLSIVTNAGGPAVLATDALIQAGGQLACLSSSTQSALDQLLPEAWSHGNPIDILGDADPERYGATLSQVLAEAESDALLAILTPQDMTDCTGVAKQLAQRAGEQGKPLFASWMGGGKVESGIEILHEAGIPTFATPEMAARAFGSMWRYSDQLKNLYATPIPYELPPQSSSLELLLAPAISQGRRLLSEFESKQLLRHYGLPTPRIELATDVEQAVAHAREIGYPVVLKLHSLTLTHKSDIGGVKLNLGDEKALRHAFDEIEAASRSATAQFEGVSVQPMVSLKDAYELIVGSSVDPQFGPVLMFGTGGQLVEVMRDYCLGLPPLNTNLARRMIEKTRIYRALQGVRGRPPVDQEQLEHFLVRFSQLVTQLPQIAEIEINPLLACERQLVILDARIVLHPAGTTPPTPAIRPYPVQYRETTTLKEGSRVVARAISPEDEPLLLRFHELLQQEQPLLSPSTFWPLNERLSHEQIIPLCYCDYAREITLLVQSLDASDRPLEVIALARLRRFQGAPQANLSLLVSSRWQGKGLGSWLLRKLIGIGAEEKVESLHATLSSRDGAMQHLCQKLGFKLCPLPESGEIRANYDLSDRA